MGLAIQIVLAVCFYASIWGAAYKFMYVYNEQKWLASGETCAIKTENRWGERVEKKSVQKSFTLNSNQNIQNKDIQNLYVKICWAAALWPFTILWGLLFKWIFLGVSAVFNFAAQGIEYAAKELANPGNNVKEIAGDKENE